MKHSRLLLMIVVTMIATLPIPTLGQVIDSMSTLPPEPIDQRDESLAVSFMASAAVSADVLAGEDALSEVSIDVNPTNPDNQVIVGHDGGLTTMNTFYTMDGGRIRFDQELHIHTHQHAHLMGQQPHQHAAPEAGPDGVHLGRESNQHRRSADGQHCRLRAG